MSIKELAEIGLKYTFDSAAIIATGLKKAAVTGKNIAVSFKDVTKPNLETAAGIGIKMGSLTKDGCKALYAGGLDIATKPEVKKAAIIGLKAAAGAGLAVGGATLVLPAVGFTAAGVGAGSLAAATQSMIGNVAAGSLFASLQSAGAAGMATSTLVGIGATGALAGAKTDFGGGGSAPANGDACAAIGNGASIPAIGSGLATSMQGGRGDIGTYLIVKPKL